MFSLKKEKRKEIKNALRKNRQSITIYTEPIIIYKFPNMW